MIRTLFLAPAILLLGFETQASDIDYKASVEVIKSQNKVNASDNTNANETIKGYVFIDRNRNGRRDRFEFGLPGAMVSNGLEVVKTNWRGFYELPARDNMTVFLTKPAGFNVPVDRNNIPQFSYHHLPEGSPELRFGGLAPTGALPTELNFPVIKTRNKKKFKIAVSGDTQPYSNNEISYVRDTLANELAQENDLEFVIVEGDVMGDDLDLFPRFKQVMSVSEKPLYLVPGNHDLDFDAKSDAHSFDTFKREFGPTYYSFDIGDVHFVVLDDVRYPCLPELDNLDGKRNFCNNPDTAPTYNGVISKDQLQWLENDLAMVPENKLIVLNMHIPLVSFVDMNATKHQVDNAAALYKIIGDRPALAFSGHTHTLEQFKAGEYYEGWEQSTGVGPTPFPQIIAGAASGSWWSGDFDDNGIPMAYQRLGAPRGYLVVEFDGNTFKETFKATGKAKTKQMSMDFLTPTFIDWYQQMLGWMRTDVSIRSATPPVNINDLPDTSILTWDDLAGGASLSVNVWNGSRDSKVYVQFDNRPMVEANRTQTGSGEGMLQTLDPFAIKRQMYVFRYAAKSMSGNERSQGFELFRGSQFGQADPQSLPEWMLTDQSNHIWTVNLPTDLGVGTHIVRVRTVDAYGRSFTETKTFEVVERTRPEPFFKKFLFE